MTTDRSLSTFLVGGARSGKSTIAQSLAEASGRPVAIVVTAEVFDEEMADRIERHQADRPDGWETLEAPTDMLAALASVAAGNCIVVDCLTLWLTNLVLADVSVVEIEDAAKQVAATLSEHDGPVVVVSNEVGLGIVPGDPLSRLFRDVQGRVNQLFARTCDRKFFVASGHLLPLSDPKTMCEELA